MPDGLKLFKDRSRIAARCEAVVVGNGGLVTCYFSTSGAHCEYSVDLTNVRRLVRAIPEAQLLVSHIR